MSGGGPLEQDSSRVKRQAVGSLIEITALQFTVSPLSGVVKRVGLRLSTFGQGDRCIEMWVKEVRFRIELGGFSIIGVTRNLVGGLKSSVFTQFE